NVKISQLVFINQFSFVPARTDQDVDLGNGSQGECPPKKKLRNRAGIFGVLGDLDKAPGREHSRESPLQRRETGRFRLPLRKKSGCQGKDRPVKREPLIDLR